jgi:hypothetical protein
MATAETHESEDSFVQISLGFTVWECESCGAEYVLDGSLACPQCQVGIEEADRIDPLVAARKAGFGHAVAQIQEQGAEEVKEPIIFANEGPRLAYDDYSDFISERVVRKTLGLSDDIQEVFRSTEWEPDTPAAIRGIQSLIDLFRQFREHVRELASARPPVALLAVHRQATRTVARFHGALLPFVVALTAATIWEARSLQQQGQEGLDRAAEGARRLSDVIERVARAQMLGPGWWIVGAEYDTGRIAWEGVDRQPGTLPEAAEYVRNTFADVPGIADLNDHFALALLPAAYVGESFQDLARLTSHAKAARELIDRAAERSGDWLSDPDAFVDAIWRGHRQLTDQVVRLGYELAREPPRVVLLQTAINVYQKLLEGPLVNLGAALALAAQIDGGLAATFSIDTTTLHTPGSIVDVLSNVERPVLAGVNTLLRNADAHYDFEIAESGVTFRDRRVEKGSITRRREVFLDDDDLFELILTVNESLIAWELALLPFVWTHPLRSMSERLAALSSDTESQTQVIRALAGLKGWVDLTFEFSNRGLVVTGRYEGPQSQNPFIALQAVLAAVLSLWEDVDVVEARMIDPAPYRNTLSIERSDFPSADEPNEFVRLSKLSIFSADVRRLTEELSPLESAQVHAQELLSLTRVGLRATSGLVELDKGAIVDTSTFVKWAMTSAFTAQPASSPPAEAQDHLAGLYSEIGSVAGLLRSALARRNLGLVRRGQTRCFGLMERLMELEQELASMITGSSSSDETAGTAGS